MAILRKYTWIICGVFLAVLFQCCETNRSDLDLNITSEKWRLIAIETKYTEVATIDKHDLELTECLLQELPKVFRYEIQNTNLFFLTPTGKISFRVQ